MGGQVGWKGGHVIGGKRQTHKTLHLYAEARGGLADGVQNSAAASCSAPPEGFYAPRYPPPPSGHPPGLISVPTHFYKVVLTDGKAAGGKDGKGGGARQASAMARRGRARKEGA